MTPAAATAFRKRMLGQAENLFPGTLMLGETEYPVAHGSGTSGDDFAINGGASTLYSVCHLSRVRVPEAPDDHLRVTLNGQPARIEEITNRDNPHDEHWRIVLGPVDR